VNKLNIINEYEQEQVKAELEARKKREMELFQSSWLKNTEREPYECIVNLQTGLQPEMEASIMANLKTITGT